MMKTQSLLPITDNITEVLSLILDFTRQRHKVLIENLNNINREGYVPRDIAVDEFAAVVDAALAEHLVNGRLTLADSRNIKFGSQGHFEAYTVVDKCAEELFETNIEEYLELQKGKLSENSLNSRLAAELLKRKQDNEKL